jgi:hypothetical protein
MVVGVHDPEIVLSGRVALVGRLSKPAHGSRIVLRNAGALEVHEPKIVLSVGVALVGRLSIPAQCSGIVLRNAGALGVLISS